MPQSSAKSFLGIALEATPNTPVASSAFIPVTSLTPKDNVTMLQDKGMRGAMVESYGHTPGPISGTLDFGGDLFVDTVGFLLAGILGDVTVTGASVPYTHAFSVLNSGNGQPKTYTLNDNYVAGNRQYAGAKFSEVAFKFGPDGFVTYSAKAVTMGSVTATAPTQSFSALPPVVGFAGVVKLGGAAVAGVMDAEVTIKRPVTVVKAVDGTQGPYQLWAGPVSVDGKMTLVMENDTQLTNYLTGVGPILDINYTSGAGATATQFQLHMSKPSYTTADISRGKDFIEIAVAFSADGNSTDIGTSAGYSPIKATIQNAIAAGVFA
jgi:hypothetical protein